MRSLAAVSVLVIFLFSVGQAQSPARILLVAGCGGQKVCGEVSIYRFVFRNGDLASQDILKTLVTDKGYFQSGKNQILQNRYALSGSGVVFDTQTGEIHDLKLGMVVGVDGNDIFINDLNFVDPSSGSTYRFDLQTKQYTRHSRPNFYALSGLQSDSVSPDGKKAVNFEPISGGMFVFTKKGRNPSDFSSFRASTGYKATCKNCSSRIIFVVPSAWIDDERFITQRENGNLVMFNYRDRKWADVVRIPSAVDVTSPPAFFKDPAGGIYYDADKLYKINIGNRSYVETDRFDLGHGFVVAGRGDRKIFFFGDKALGRIDSAGYVATDGYLAAEFKDTSSGDSRPAGIQVWGNNGTRSTTIRIKYSPRIIGWITE